MTRKEFLKKRNESIMAAVKSGQSVAKVAAEHELTPTTVAQYCNVAGFSPYTIGAGPPPGRFCEIVALLQQGLSVPKVATRVGLTRQRIHQIGKECRLAGVQLGSCRLAFGARNEERAAG